MKDARKRATKAPGGDKNKKRKTKRDTGKGTTPPKTYQANDQGCEHDNPKFWQPASKEYSNHSWRRKRGCRVSLNCSNCHEVV